MKKAIILLSLMSVLAAGCAYPPDNVSTTTKARDTRDSEQRFNDAAIETKIKGSYINNKLMGDNNLFVSNIHVNAFNNVVYLTGTVDTQEQADNAIKLAKEVRGVKQVVSHITIAPAR